MSATEEERIVRVEQLVRALQEGVHRLSAALAKRVAGDVADGKRTLTPDLQEWFEEHGIEVPR